MSRPARRPVDEPQAISQMSDPNNRLDKADRDLVARAINSFGTGGHPMAQQANISYFTFEYALRCLLDATIYDMKERGRG